MQTLFSPALPSVKKLRDYQDACVCAFFDYFSEKTGNPVFVAPTGAGKSLIICEIIIRARKKYPGTRFTYVSHVAELGVQFARTLIEQDPSIRISFCSDKLGSKDLSGEVIVATVQTIWKKALKYPYAPDILIIDEAHLLSYEDDSMYRRFIAELKIINPYLKVVGFTASPFRADKGYLHKGENALFTDIAYEIGLLDLISQGYLTPVITPQVNTHMDVHGVKIRGGDYVARDLERAVDVDVLTRACVKEIVEFGKTRNKWLIFSAGVSHCEHIRDEIRRYGIICEMVTGKTPTEERNSIISRFRNGDIQAVVNVTVLTVGFDNPSIDLMAFMRPMRSPVLYLQSIGRGMRLFPGKTDTLLLDFAGVVATLGPVDQLHIKEKQKGNGEAPTKFCPQCKAVCHAAAMECQDCGYIFPERELDIDKTASSAAVLSTQLQTETHEVTGVMYYRHTKEKRPDSLRIEYLSGPMKSFRQWMLFEASGRHREEACAWWRSHAATLPPNTVTDALARISELKKPKSIDVRRVGKFFTIVKEEL